MNGKPSGLPMTSLLSQSLKNKKEQEANPQQLMTSNDSLNTWMPMNLLINQTPAHIGYYNSMESDV
jgi:hypothetical protein